ncbi:hypothetical protein O181_001712 [Austropuccinia psidii MF-1]|uniref:Uncharacterized protein n=1 Tax=Austropuccinia psidii MF-1 TaxID=1389203 RepID=A0A9Q3GDB6_9BASI|nr:hypothetical protein [Austropuccinia psidii MF-1]
MAWSFAKIFRLPTYARNLTLAGTMFMNTNSIPIALMQSLSAALPRLKSGVNDTPDKALGRAVSYLAVYSLLGTLLRWSYGIQLFETANGETGDHSVIKKPHEDVHEIHISLDGKNNEENSSWSISRQKPNDHSESVEAVVLSMDSIRTLNRKDLSRSQNSVEAAPKFDSPRAPNGEVQGAIGTAPSGFGLVKTTKGEVNEAEKENGQSQNLQEVPLGDTGHQPAESRDPEKGEPEAAIVTKRIFLLNAFWTRLHLLFPPRFRAFLNNFRQLINPPLLSAVAAIVIASIPPIQQGLRRIEMFRHFIKSAGNVSIPLTLVVLGSFFSQASPNEKLNEKNEKLLELRKYVTRKKNLSERKKIIFLTLFLRHLVVPLILLPLLFLMVKFSLLSIVKDPVFLMTSVLIIGAPPAITLAQMTSKSSGDYDRIVSSLLLWSFSLITPFTTILLVTLAMAIREAQI